MDKTEKTLTELRVQQFKSMLEVLKKASSKAVLDAYSITVYGVPYENLTDKSIEAIAEDNSKYRCAVNFFSDTVRSKYFKLSRRK